MHVIKITFMTEYSENMKLFLLQFSIIFLASKNKTFKFLKLNLCLFTKSIIPKLKV